MKILFHTALILSTHMLFAGENEVALKVKTSIHCPDVVKEAQKNGDYKLAIRELETLIKKKPTSDLYLTLASTHLADQHEEEAFLAYSKCLELAQVKKGQSPSSREQTAFNELLSLYLENSPGLDGKVQEVMNAHPDYHYCQFLLASSCANQRKYDSFFYLFYQSYISYPDSHLAHKTKGVVASLLLQRAKSQEEKDRFRKVALGHFAKALDALPQDKGLHKMMIYTTTEKERVEVVQLVINKIIDKDVQVGRTEIPFYINHALGVEDKKLAQALIEKAKSWYQYSRVLQDMQKLVDEHQQL